MPIKSKVFLHTLFLCNCTLLMAEMEICMRRHLISILKVVFHIVVWWQKNQSLLRPTKVIFNPLFVGRCKVVKIANQNDGFDAPLNSEDQYKTKTSQRQYFGYFGLNSKVGQSSMLDYFQF